MMLDKQELHQVRDYVVRTLPDLLREDPEIATTIEGILAQHFPRRDEFARLLDELQLLREQMEQRLTLLREDMDRRFEQMEQRFEQMDRRFEQMEQRFILLSETMEQRFGQTDRTLLAVRRDAARLQHSHEMILERMDHQESWLNFVTGNLRSEKGKTLEDMFATALRYGLKNPDITPDKIRLRQELVDAEGRVFKTGFETEVDLIAEDSRLIVFEVKATAKSSDVDFFALKVDLAAAQNPDKSVEGVFISLAASPAVQQRCAHYGLALLG
ncbi:MAG: hypothetical protein MAG451_01882 [Anaerolineales bacterium]|nr:hypothetical protein [Anaerolineales bacterium]